MNESPQAQLDEILGGAADAADTRLIGPGPSGSLPLTAEMLRQEPSGNLFGLTQNAGMGWNPAEVARPQVLILSTQGGLRAEDGEPIALGYHTGHWEIGLLVRRAAETLRERGAALRRVLQRPLRWPQPGHHCHVRQPALPQRRRLGDASPDPFIADPGRRYGCRDL